MRDDAPVLVAAPRTTRQARRIGAATLALATALVLVPPLAQERLRHWWYDDTPLFQQTVGLRPDGGRVPVTSSSTAFLAGTRVLDPGEDAPAAQREAAQALAQNEISWLESGTPPGRDTRWAGMVTDALADLHVLTYPGGGTVAGWSSAWQYVWPRDASFVVAALARSGHGADATALLHFLQDNQHPDGTFEARYRPDGSGPPDGRGVQLDGSGWVLWALGRWASDGGDLAEPSGLRPLLDRATDAALRALDAGDGLPPPSADYWEVPEERTTLATAAALAAGLESAVALYGMVEDPARERAARAGAERLRAAIVERFGPDGYPRHVGGSARDLGVALLLPPFCAPWDDATRASLLAARDLALAEARRPAGGVAPGADWKSDGVSWTPETAVFALSAAATGDRATAESLLDWLDTHRTAAGSLPEKVLHDGSPASVAPLTWTAAAVVLAVDALERGVA